MPYIGRAPVGVAGNIIEGDLKVTGTISGESINSKFGLDATDSSKSNINDHITIEAGGTDGSGTNANDDLLLEETTSGEAEGLPGLASSTSGQALTSAGPGSTPTFSTISSGMNFISKTEITSDVATVVVDVPETTYTDFVIVLRDIHTKTDGITRMRWSNDGGTTFTDQNYGFFTTGGRGGSVLDDGAATPGGQDAYGSLGHTQWNNVGAAWNGTIDVTTAKLDGPGNRQVAYRWTAAYDQTASNYQSWVSGACNVVATGYITAFEISNAGGDLERGIILLYGLAES